MIRRPPRSTLFPYTTLFRSNGRTPLPLPRVAPHDFAFTAGRLWDKGKNLRTLDLAAAELAVPLYMAGRSEEHTSELQSRQYLVCRLLLEKKKRPGCALLLQP